MDSTQLTRPATIAPQNAAQNPSTWNGTPNQPLIAALSQNSSAFTTRANRPRVSSTSGQDSTFAIGRTVALTTPKTRPTRRYVATAPGVVRASTSTPSTSSTATASPIAFNTTRSTKSTAEQHTTAGRAART